MWLKRPAVPVLGWSCVVSILLWLMGNFWLCACYFPLPSLSLQCPPSGTEESPSCSSFPRFFIAAALLLDLTLWTHFVCSLTNQFWIGPVGDDSSLPQNDEKICTVDRKKNGLRRDWKWNSEYEPGCHHSLSVGILTNWWAIATAPWFHSQCYNMILPHPLFWFPRFKVDTG